MAGGVDEPDLIPDFSREEGGLRVIEHDALLSVEPARRVIDTGDHRLDAYRGELVDQRRAAAGGIGGEHLALPREVVDEAGDQAGPKRAGPDDGFAFGIALGKESATIRVSRRASLPPPAFLSGGWSDTESPVFSG